MLVSAISANSKMLSLNSSYINTRGNDNTGETTSNNSSSNSDVYKNINEWKHFCHKQIDKGNLDIIA